ncbi:uncharacterized protein LOC119578784 [Penaeus monodon]|uniref:uncharacterized protein LOC119578784 n=1 Tax=Penaeus monodon TaxID=6687 RepID=UPI0018A74ACE|nr:uncharacterized protein LOC119578784 [Penaeus monodon]
MTRQRCTYKEAGNEVHSQSCVATKPHRHRQIFDHFVTQWLISLGLLTSIETYLATGSDSSTEEPAKMSFHQACPSWWLTFRIPTSCTSESSFTSLQEHRPRNLDLLGL